MAHDHNHDHEHEERELITLVDEQGNETLFEILLTIDGKEEFGKNYVLLIPANAEEDENGESMRFKLIPLPKMKMAQKATCSQSQKTQMLNGI